MGTFTLVTRPVQIAPIALGGHGKKLRIIGAGLSQNGAMLANRG
jgi:hypothetical protein